MFISSSPKASRAKSSDTFCDSIRSRTASMNLANALVAKKTDALNLRNLQQNTRLTVLTAVSSVNSLEDDPVCTPDWPA